MGVILATPVVTRHNILSVFHSDATVDAVTRGSLMYGNATPEWDELVLGAAATFVRSDGTDVAWSAIQVTDLPAHNLLSAQHGDTVVQAATRGSLIYGDATSDWNELVIGALSTHLESDGTDFAWQANLTMADDAWVGLGAAAGRLVFDVTPAPDQVEVTDADLNFVTAAHGIVHVDGVVAGTYLRADGTRYVPNTIQVTDVPAHSLLSAQHGDTAVQAVTQGSLVYGDATPDWNELPIGAAATYLRSDGTDPSWAAITVADITDIATDYLLLDASNDPVTGDLVIRPANSTTAFQVEQADTSIVFNVDTTNKRVGVNAASALRAVEVYDTGAVNTAVVRVIGTNTAPDTIAELGVIDSPAVGFAFFGTFTANDMHVTVGGSSRMTLNATTLGRVTLSDNASTDDNSVDARLHIFINTNTEKGLIVRGDNAQTATLLQLREFDDSVFLDSGDGLGGSVFSGNQQLEDIDFVWAGDGEANLFRIDAGANATRMGDWDTNYVAFAINGDQTFVGTAGFYPRRITQSAEPGAGTGATQIDTGELLIWRDPDDNKTYLVYNDTDEGVRLSEMI